MLTHKRVSFSSESGQIVLDESYLKKKVNKICDISQNNSFLFYIWTGNMSFSNIKDPLEAQKKFEDFVISCASYNVP